MQLFSNQLQLIYLLLSSLTTALGNPLGSLTTIGTPHLNLVVSALSSNNSINRVTYCKHDVDPYHFKSSLNYTFPDTPSLPQSIINSAGIVHDEGEYAFDCFIEMPGGVVVLEVRHFSQKNRRSGLETLGVGIY